MAKSDTGPNNPCPCGSGLKYKKCCMVKYKNSRQGALEFFAQLHEVMENTEFESFEEAESFVNDYVAESNRAPQDDFCGLSPDIMGELLHYPFDSPDLLEFSYCLDTEPVAPIVTLFRLLSEAIGEEGLKPTAKGNLPRKFLREAALAYMGEEKYREYTEYGEILKESDFREMEITRIIAELAGLVRKYKGRFILSQKCRNILKKDGMKGIYPQLLRAYTDQYNWGYQDLYPETDFIRRSFAFTLYLLHLYGAEWRPNSFYEDAFVRAFPFIVEETPELLRRSPETVVCDCYSLRSLRRFAQFLGLIEVQMASDSLFERVFELRKLPLFDDAIVFHLSGQSSKTGHS